MPVNENQTKVPSQCLQELSRGKFLVKYEDIILKETIGEGVLCTIVLAYYPLLLTQGSLE